MKDSGTSWLGIIPKDWELSKINSVYVLRVQKVSDKEYSPLSVTMNGIVPQLETAAKTNAHDDRKLVRKGDFVINSRSDRRGSCGVSEYDGSVSLINIVMKPRDEMNPVYYNWLFHTVQFADEFYKWGHGIVDDLWTTNWRDMKHIDISVPPIKTQQKIADFLDKKCSEIDALHSEIEKQIETLAEYKKSIITEAVTKGLDPDVEMKDSGVEWIGEIPKGWEVSKIKYLFSASKGLSITKENLTEEGLPVVSYGQIHSKTNTGVDISNELLRFIPYDYQYNNKSCKVNKFDFIFADTSEDFDGCGNCVYKRNDDLLFAGYHSIVLHSKHNRDNRYLAFLFLTDLWRKQLRERASGVKVFSITQKNITNSSVVLPSKEEQKNIADYLDKKCSDIDSIIADKKQQLVILEKYKKSLIYEYVTGKKEVSS